jgi:hypothetical protein
LRARHVTAADRYWGAATSVWNNGGDKTTLTNRAATAIDPRSWSRDGSGYTYC